MASWSAKTKSTKPSKRPWLHGPVAWEVTQRADAVTDSLNARPKRFLSLRQAAAIVGVSTQPIRDWLKAGLLEATGPRKRIPITSLTALVKRFQADAKPYCIAERANRFSKAKTGPQRPFAILRQARFEWPKQIKTRTPVEIAKLIGCHPSTIIRAIHAKELFADRRSPCRWEISRRRWEMGISSWGFEREKKK